ncbi:regulator of G-protein signaling 8-like [Pollicipes pollicipes]|uniref:regulator of G-protein signaling 8-like n=1 Tax=Pollicipes pollicipes TaxID=41117 RepID=UPI001885982D|nr:regulator of G-protein signaling 8-like [Pollicipes pollicipes]
MPKNKPESYNKVTAQQIEEWTSSFDRLLASDRGRDMFMEHLLHEGTERHLEFWLRCQRLSDAYKQVKDDANAIYETFLDIDAPKKVNVYREAEAVRQRLEQKESEGFGVFEEAQYKVKARMEQDSYPGFCVELMKMKKSLK